MYEANSYAEYFAVTKTDEVDYSSVYYVSRIAKKLTSGIGPAISK